MTDGAAPEPARSAEPDSLIVLGASAGGVEALIAFFEALPVDLDAAFLVTLHRSPDVTSALGDVLRHHTTMPVVELGDPGPIRRGHVYVPPPRGRIFLTCEGVGWEHVDASTEESHGPIHSIDHALMAVVDCWQDRAVAVILSGTGSDGALGASAIKAHGGLVLVQDPDEAAFDGMPRSTTDTVAADVIGGPSDLARALRSVIEAEGRAREVEVVRSDPLDKVLEVVKARNGYDFRSYRRSTVSRRVHRRAALAGRTDIGEYLERLEADAGEREALCRDLLINVTGFFRDPDAFEALDQRVIEPLVEKATAGRPVRVWVPGCATGEEAYSIAMLLTRAMERAGHGVNFQIFATDLDAAAIETAGRGEFPDVIQRTVPADLLRRFFRKADDRYVVNRSLRERMVFAVHDLTQDPPFTRMDLVSCRNLLIYFRNELQHHVLQLLAYAMTSSGNLLLGASESTPKVREFFDVVDGEHRIYRRNGTTVVPPRLHSLDSLLRDDSSARERAPMTFDASPRGTALVQAGIVETLVLRDAEFALALDTDLRLIHVYGDPGNALRVPSGGITTDVSALTRGEFKAAILSSVPAAHRAGQDVVSRAVALDGAEGVRTVDVQVLPLRDVAGPIASLVIVRPRAKIERPAPSGVIESPSEHTALDLERELHATRDRLSETVEALEVTNEELQTSNEELMATNEELQSTNEELQSANEELHTINAQHEQQIERLTEVTHDLENVLVNSEVGTILLDRELCIHRYTEVAAQIVHLMDQDRGRPLHHITHSLVDVDLTQVARHVVGSGEAREESVRTEDGRSHLMRCHPLRDDARRIDGVMITFTDVTVLERVTDELRRSEQRFRHVMEHIDQAVFLRSRDDQSIEFVSGHVTEFFGDERAITTLDAILDFVHEEDVDVVRDAFDAPVEFAVEVDFRLASDEDRWLHCSLCPTDVAAGPEGFDVGYIVEISVRKRSEMELRRGVERFEGFVSAIPDRFFWRGLDGAWQRLRALMTDRTIDEERYPSLGSIVSRAALRAIDEAAGAAQQEGTLQSISFDAHDDKGSRSYEARLLMVAGQGVICALRDITDLRRSERELVSLTRSLEREANSDHLTRLPNRRGLEKVLFTEIERCRRLGSRLCAILVDCDNFKRVNDTMGHATGDVVLQEIGKRLRGVVRPSDTIGRVGGDEFLVLLPDTRHAEAMQLAERLRLAITGSPLTSGRDVIGITGSLGVATVPQDLVSIEEVISLTQHALSHSKKVGKNRVTSHELEGLEAVDPRDELLTVLETGRGFRTFAQPILDLQTGQINGYELLTRGPGGALESPADIFQLSSENNILTSVDLHCVKRNVGWARDHLDRGRFHVNLFPSTILDTPAARLLAVFGDPGLLQHFCVEISEQQFIGDPMYLRPHVEELRREGAQIALDDVGFGRSSLESLLLLEPETVKLDKSVVCGAHEDAAKRRTLERLVGVIRGIDAEIVAEGIETEADRSLLVDLGVDYGQGYLFGKPSAELVTPN